MPAPLLPIDILPEILQHFIGELDEPVSLHKLLFVNRTWCRTVLPLLWANPFLLCQQPENRVKLIATFVTCLSDHDKSFIAERGIPTIPKERPTMDYALYITHVEEKNVIESVNNWYQQIHPSEDKYEATVIAAMLYKMFIERSKHIKWLNLDCDQINAKWHTGDIIHQPYMADKILESLAKHQHSLQRIAVSFNTNGPPTVDCTHLSKLVAECVKVQGRFLRDFVVENATGEGFAEITHALRPRANSLKRVGYTQCDFQKFPWSVGIEILSQVNELYFIACTNLRDDQLRLLEGRMEKPFPEFYYYILKGLES